MTKAEEMADARVSAIIPVFNGERYLAEAIESVFAQTSPASEIVVVDDGSTDGSRAVAERFGAPVRLVFGKHAGAGAARNRGVAESTGELIAFLDGDDIWPSDKLERQLAALCEDPAADFALGHSEEFVSPELDAATKARLAPRPPRPSFAASALVVSRAVMERIPFSTAPVGEFLEWILQARDQGVRGVMLPHVVMRRRLHGDNSSLRRRDSRGEFAQMIKRSLDRRRAAS
jgi:glycosyltransferase involved in cell wall biosynthesis